MACVSRIQVLPHVQVHPLPGIPQLPRQINCVSTAFHYRVPAQVLFTSSGSTRCDILLGVFAGVKSLARTTRTCIIPAPQMAALVVTVTTGQAMLRSLAGLTT